MKNKCQLCANPATLIFKQARIRIKRCDDHTLLEDDPTEPGQKRISFSKLLASKKDILLVPSLWTWQKID